MTGKENEQKWMKQKGRKKNGRQEEKDKIMWVKCYNPKTNFAFHNLVSATLLQKNTLLPPRKTNKTIITKQKMKQKYISLSVWSRNLINRKNLLVFFSLSSRDWCRLPLNSKFQTALCGISNLHGNENRQKKPTF